LDKRKAAIGMSNNIGGGFVRHLFLRLPIDYSREYKEYLPGIDLSNNFFMKWGFGKDNKSRKELGFSLNFNILKNFPLFEYSQYYHENIFFKFSISSIFKINLFENRKININLGLNSGGALIFNKNDIEKYYSLYFSDNRIASHSYFPFDFKVFGNSEIILLTNNEKNNLYFGNGINFNLGLMKIITSCVSFDFPLRIGYLFQNKKVDFFTDFVIKPSFIYKMEYVHTWNFSMSVSYNIGFQINFNVKKNE